MSPTTVLTEEKRIIAATWSFMIIIELKNKTRYYYELNDKDSFLIDTIFDYNDEIEYINLKDYPYYILNSPLGYLKEEK